MPSLMLPSAEWISAASRQAARPSNTRSSTPGVINPPSPDSDSPQTMAPAMAGATTAAAATGVNVVDVRTAGDVYEHETFVGHRGSGGLVTGKAVFCLPPNVEWFQGHFAYAARGGCTASLGVLGTELPVDPCMRCCFGGFSRYKLIFIHYESGKESALVVERYGGNMMSLHAEAPGGDEGGSAEEPNSELAFQTHVMKADDDARELLDRYFQSVVRAAPDPEDLRECIVCIGQMDVPLSLLQELAAPLPDGARNQFMVCSAFVPCREAPQHHYQQQHNQHHHHPRAQQRSTNEPTPDLSPCSRRASRAVTMRDGERYDGCLGSAGGDVASRPRDRVAGGDACGDENDPRGEGSGGYPGDESAGERGVHRRQGRGDESDDDWL